MAEDTTAAPDPVDGTIPTDPAGSSPRPRPSAAASAASRARRIGGRVTPIPAEPPAAPEPADAEPPVEPERDAAPKRGRLSLRKTVPIAPTDPGAEAAHAGVDGPEDAGPEVAGPPPEVPVWLRWTPAAVLTAGVLTMAVLLTVFSHGVWWGRPSGNAVREEMLAAAKTCVARTNTYKYTELDKYTKAAHQCTTGQLTGQLDRTIETIIKRYAPTLKANQTAQISRGALESVSPHGKQWTVLVFGQLTVVNTNDPKGRTDPFAAQVRMEKVHGKWLMSGLKTVATPVS